MGIHSGLLEDRHSFDPPNEEGGAVCLGFSLLTDFSVFEGKVDDNAGIVDSTQ